MIAEGTELTEKERARLRMEVETFYDIQDLRIVEDNRLQNYSELVALAELIGWAEVKRLRSLGDKNVEFKKQVRERKLEKHAHPQHQQYVLNLAAAMKELEDDEHHKKVTDLFVAQEKIIVKTVTGIVKEHPLWTEWLSKVTGIGPIIAGGLLAWVDITRCTYVGNLWKYAGLAVTIDRYECPVCHSIYKADEIPDIEERVLQGSEKGPAHCKKEDCPGKLAPFGRADRREKGKVVGYNPRLKTLMWKASQSFVKMNPERSGYRRLYEKFRLQIDEKTKNGCHTIHLDSNKKPLFGLDENNQPKKGCYDAHRFAMATRATVKIFASHVYWVWRGLHGLPRHEPYAFGFLGHAKEHFIEPIYDDKK